MARATAVDLTQCPTNVVAAVLGITVETVRQRARAGVFKPTGRGKYDLVEVARIEREHVEAGRRSSVVSIETARLKRAQAERAELENATRRAELLPREDLREVLSGILVTVVGMFDGLASRMAAPLAAESDPALVRKLLLEEHRNVRDTASRRLEVLGAVPAGSGPAQAATGANARPVGRRKPRAATRKRGARKVAKQ